MKLFHQTNDLRVFSVSAMTIAIWLLLVLGCSGGTESSIIRGRLKFVKGGNHQYFYINDKKWSPKDDKKFADKMNWCDTSPNPNIEILRCFGDATENYRTTYILRMKGNEVEIQKLDDGVGSVWTNDEGRWLLFRKFFVNVETGEKIEVKGMPFADNSDSSAPVIYVLAVSPDMKTVVADLGRGPVIEGNERFLTLQIIDTETGKVENWKVNFTKNQWLDDHQNPDNDSQPPPAPSKKMVWEKGSDGKDKLIVPQLLEIVEKKDQKPK